MKLRIASSQWEQSSPSFLSDGLLFLKFLISKVLLKSFIHDFDISSGFLSAWVAETFADHVFFSLLVLFLFPRIHLLNLFHLAPFRCFGIYNDLRLVPNLDQCLLELPLLSGLRLCHLFRRSLIVLLEDSLFLGNHFLGYGDLGFVVLGFIFYEPLGQDFLVVKVHVFVYR